MKSIVKLRVLLVLLAFLLCAGQAGATQFNFAFSGTGISGSGTLTGVDSGSGYYNVISGSATVTGLGNFAIFANANAPGTSTSPLGLFFYNDLLYHQDPLLDTNGLLFANGNSQELNIWGNGTGNPYSAWIGAAGGYPLTSNDVSFEVTPVPEPGTVLLLSAGLFGLAVFSKRRKNA